LCSSSSRQRLRSATTSALLGRRMQHSTFDDRAFAAAAASAVWNTLPKEVRSKLHSIRDERVPTRSHARPTDRRPARYLPSARQCHVTREKAHPVRPSIGQRDVRDRSDGGRDARTTTVWSRRNRLRSVGQPGTVRRPALSAGITPVRWFAVMANHRR